MSAEDPDIQLWSARRAFWEQCCAATLRVDPGEGEHFQPTRGALEGAVCSAQLADAKLAEWDKRWGRNGVAP